MGNEGGTMIRSLEAGVCASEVLSKSRQGCAWVFAEQLSMNHF